MGASSKLLDFFVSRDIFGHPIGVHYKGGGTFQTGLGSFVTLSAQILMLVNLITLSIAFFDHSNQEEKI